MQFCSTHREFDLVFVTHFKNASENSICSFHTVVSMDIDNLIKHIAWHSIQWDSKKLFPIFTLFIHSLTFFSFISGNAFHKSK